MDSKDNVVLRKIIDEAAIIMNLTAGFDCDSYLKDERTKRAVCMTLINIGELVKLLSDDARQANTAIPWRRIAGLRDVAAHGYQTLRMEDIWKTAITDIPNLLEELKKTVSG